MSRNRIRIPTGVRAAPVAIPVSDKSKLLWERYYKPMQAAAATFNAAVANTENLLAGLILEMEGKDPADFVFDMSAVAIIPRPRPRTGENGA